MLNMAYVGPWVLLAPAKFTEESEYLIHLRHENLSNSGSIANTDFYEPIVSIA